MPNSTLVYPHTAAPTWSGFIYQGHVALYHSIVCLMCDLKFDLQIDSIDDFSMIVNGAAHSTHQVKAMADDKRSSYTKALEQAAATNMLCTATTKRYFHVSSCLDNTSDFTGKNNNEVSFYIYDDGVNNTPYCYLHEIEKIVKNKIRQYLIAKSLPVTDFLLDLKFNALHSQIAAKVVYIHACNQDGLMSAATAAFTQTLSSDEIKELLEFEVTNDKDIAYLRIKARLSICKYFYEYINYINESGSVKAINEKLSVVYEQIKNLKDEPFTWLWKSLCFGSSTHIISNDSVFDYVDIIHDIKKHPLLMEKPPFYKCSDGDFYLPTAITVNSDRREGKFAEDLIKQLKSDPDMIDILVEHEWLIATQAKLFSPAERFCEDRGLSRDTVEEEFKYLNGDSHNVTKALDAKIISKEEASIKIND